MSKYRLFFYSTLLLAASQGYAQERSAGGTHEVQMSWTALKTMVNNATELAKSGITIGSNAQVSATQAKKAADDAQDTANKGLAMATALKKCTSIQRFYDPNNDSRDSNDCVAPGGGGGTRALFVAKMDNNPIEQGAATVDIIKPGSPDPDPMLLDISCNVSAEGVISGDRIGLDGHTEYHCYTKDKDWSVDLGLKSGGWKNLDHGHASGLGCGYAKPVALSYYVRGGYIYQGSIITTPDGIRVAGQNVIMPLDKWNGKVHSDACWGNVRATYYNNTLVQP